MAIPRSAGVINYDRRSDRHLLRAGENCNAFAVDAVNGAEREILVSADSLTTGSGIPEALARAAERGVDVRVIADRTTPCGRNVGIDLIVRAGASVWIDQGVRIAHAKTMVIDDKVTLVGSMNWSKGAALNSENLNLVVSPEVAETYAAHWRQRLRPSVPFTGRRMVPTPHCRRRLMKIVSRLFWSLLDWLDYRIWDERLRIVDALYGPEPDTEADRERKREKWRC